jgi:hypothetical protein
MNATEKQLDFITSLGGTVSATIERTAASKMIGQLLAAERAFGHAKGSNPVTEVGMYRTAEGTIYKVQRSKLNGNLYAKKLTPINGQRLRDVEVGVADSIVNFEFVYDAGAIRNLTAEMRLTPEKAKEFGIRYGVCCVCGKTLRDADSVQAGIGPVCETRL